MKVKKYDFLSYNFYPFLWINNNKKKLKLTIQFNSFVNIMSVVSLKRISNKAKYEKYKIDYKKCISSLKCIHLIELLIFSMLIFVSPLFGLYLCSAQLIVICLYHIKSSEIIIDALYNHGVHENNSHYLFLNTTLDDCDKTEIYMLMQEKISHDDYSNIMKNKVINIILIDSIVDEKDYLSENMKGFLNRFLLSDFKELNNQIDNLRNISLYYIYLLHSNSNNLLLREKILKNWGDIHKQNSKSILGINIMELLKSEEKFDIYNKYEIYYNKIRRVYRIFNYLKVEDNGEKIQ